MVKRLFDIVFSVLGLLLLSPLLFCLALAIKVDSKGPILYRGKRVGKERKLFCMYKFRTMLADAEKQGGPTTSSDDVRVTNVGKLLRKYKIDELPQLINVLKGEMSMVGPRPEVKEVTDMLTAVQRKIIFSVKPGITDYASIKFSNEGKLVKGSKDSHAAYLKNIWPEKVKLQMDYIKERTFLTDMKIIIKTLARLVW